MRNFQIGKNKGYVFICYVFVVMVKCVVEELGIIEVCLLLCERIVSCQGCKMVFVYVVFGLIYENS